MIDGLGHSGDAGSSTQAGPYRADVVRILIAKTENRPAKE